MRYKIFAVFAIVALATIIAAAMMTVGEVNTDIQPVVSATPIKASVSFTSEKFDGAKVSRSESEWKKLLTSEQYHILREKGTEQPYTGAYDKNKRAGTYTCAACDLALFRSKAKFDSGTGWPSFYEPIYKENVEEEADRSLGDVRTEVLCHRCGGHLGHVFDDGPEPTGLRYCINSVALKFKPSK